MRTESQKALKAGQTKIKATARSIKKEVKPSWFQKQMVKIYLKSPLKVQYVLAKYGIKHVVKKKKDGLEHMIRH